MDHLAIKSTPLQAQGLLLSAPAWARAARLGEFPFLVSDCAKTDPGQKDSACLGVIQSLQHIIIELWIHLTQNGASADPTQRETTSYAKMPLGTPTWPARLQNPSMFPVPNTQNLSAVNLQSQFDSPEVFAALFQRQIVSPDPFNSANPPGLTACFQAMSCSVVVLLKWRLLSKCFCTLINSQPGT